MAKNLFLKKNIVCLSLLSFVLAMGFSSCKSDDDSHRNFVNGNTDLKISKDGGSARIQMNTTDWEIVKIIDKSDNSAIKGNILLGTDENDTQEEYNDTTLALQRAEFGSLIADTGKKGFLIKRYMGKTLQLAVNENYTLSAFSFVIVLRSGKATKEITVTQEASCRYQFKSIAYSLEQGDGVSPLYWYDDTANALTRGMGDSEYSYDWTFSPHYDMYLMNKMSAFCTATFSSDDKNAFGWPSTEDNDPDVTVPIAVQDGKIVYAYKTVEYNTKNKGVFTNFELPDKVPVKLSPGINKVYFKFGMLKTIVTYTLTLTDTQTNADRQFKGKWTLVQPSQYELVNIVQ